MAHPTHSHSGLGHMMTFLTVSDTSVCGRTCQNWLRVAYERTPRKLPGATLLLVGAAPAGVGVKEAAVADETHVNELMLKFVQSPYKRHFNKLRVEISSYDTVLDQVCPQMNAITEFTYFRSDPSAASLVSTLSLSLTPLVQYHSKTLTRLTIMGVYLDPSDLELIQQNFSSLVTFEVLEADWNVRVDHSQPRPLKPLRWTPTELRALCQPNNKLAQLRDFRFNLAWSLPLSNHHFDSFIHLPVEAFNSFTPEGGMTVDFVKNLGYFKHLRELSLFVKDKVELTFELLCDAFQELTFLETLTVLTPDNFQQGQLSKFLLHQTRLTSLTFHAVEFESPSCLKEIPRQLVNLKFQECGTVGFDHLMSLAGGTSLQLLSRCGRTVPHVLLTLDQVQQLAPPHSHHLFPALKEFHYGGWEV